MSLSLPVDEFYRRWLRYPLWRLANPLAPYERFYADVVLKRLRRIGHHDAIGATARPIRASTELLDIMRTHGLEPHHRFVDYGCGSLRLGKAVLDYLEPHNFFGMDVTAKFLDLGRQFIGADVERAKQPNLLVISPQSLWQVTQAKPDYIGSWHVCSKVPTRELARYFASIICLMGEASQAFIQFPCSAERRRLNHLNWTLSQQELTEIVHGIDPLLRIDFVAMSPTNELGVSETYAWLSYRQDAR